MTDEPPNPIDDAAARLGLHLPQACREGVAANLDLLARHARILDDYLEKDRA